MLCKYLISFFINYTFCLKKDFICIIIIYVCCIIYVLYMLQNNIKYLLLIFTYKYSIFDTVK